MKLRIFIFFAFTLALKLATAQHCGTMDLLDSLYVKRPELRAVHDSINRATQVRIYQNYPWAQPSSGKFSAIPGFVETGNREEDLRNYYLAKELLYRKDPDNFFRLTRDTTGQKR